MFVKTQYERIVNLTHYSTIKIDFSLPIYGRHYHRIWVETTDGKCMHVLAEWRVDINNNPTIVSTARKATQAFDAIFKNLVGGESAFDLKAFISKL